MENTKIIEIIYFGLFLMLFLIWLTLFSNAEIIYLGLFLMLFLIWLTLFALWAKYNDLANKIYEVNTSLINIMAKNGLDEMNRKEKLE